MKKIICISRQFASGGHEVGKRLAKRCGIPFYDSEIITESVKKAGISEEVIRNHDEASSNSLIYSIAMGHYMKLGGRYVEGPGDQVFRVQSEVIRDLAAAGSCVIVGRCAGEILLDEPGCYRIFIHADDAFRAKRAVERYGCQGDTVVELLKQRDRERRAYHTRYTNIPWGETSSYDLSINTSRVEIGKAVETILAFIE